MDGAKQAVGRGTTPGRDAIEWFVENDSERELDEAMVLRWEDWCRHARNEAEYLRVVEMCIEIHGLPAPSDVSREELLRDALAESGPGS